MIEERLEKLWQQLQGKKPHLPHFLSQVWIDGLRDAAEGVPDARARLTGGGLDARRASSRRVGAGWLPLPYNVACSKD